MSKIKLYHGGYEGVTNPDLSYSSKTNDFGMGFYLTDDLEMAKQWSCNRVTSIITEFELDVDNLKIHHFNQDEEWLHYVIGNRCFDEPTLEEEYDVLIGMDADDFYSLAIVEFDEEFISEKEKIKLLASRNMPDQYCLKTEKAIKKLKYIKSYPLSREEVKRIEEQMRIDNDEMREKIRKLLYKKTDEEEKSSI